jgi:hypothetical protein
VEEGLVLGHVVAGPAQVAEQLGHRRPVGRGHVDPEARFARVSAAAAVDVDVEGLVEGQAPAYGCGALTGTGGS